MGDLTNTYDKVYALRKYKGRWMQHAPLHPMELRGTRQLHGHSHYSLMLKGEGGGEIDDRYINCCVEYVGYIPVLFDYITSAEYIQECRIKYTKYRERGLI